MSILRRKLPDASIWRLGFELCSHSPVSHIASDVCIVHVFFVCCLFENIRFHLNTASRPFVNIYRKVDNLELGRSSSQRYYTSPILYTLAASLFHLLLPLALRRGAHISSSSSSHTSQSASHTRECSPRQPNRVQRHDHPQPPRLVPENAYGAYTTPGPVQDVPHVLRQAGSAQILTSRA